MHAWQKPTKPKIKPPKNETLCEPKNTHICNIFEPKCMHAHAHANRNEVTLLPPSEYVAAQIKKSTNNLCSLAPGVGFEPTRTWRYHPISPLFCLSLLWPESGKSGRGEVASAKVEISPRKSHFFCLFM
jgi:hypothetical protein